MRVLTEFFNKFLFFLFQLVKLVDKPAIIPNGEPVEEAHSDEGDDWQVNISHPSTIGHQN